jgi:hypothetical protein
MHPWLLESIQLSMNGRIEFRCPGWEPSVPARRQLTGYRQDSGLSLPPN